MRWDFLKYYLVSLNIIFAINSYAQKDIHCDLLIDSTTVSITNYVASAGDTLCLMAGYRPQLYLKNIKGSEEKPVVIINYQGKTIIDSDLSYGLKFAKCRYVKICGNGVDSIEYGVDIRRVALGNGINIGGKSSDFEIENIEISNTKYVGIVAKTDPDCTFSAVRDSFTMYHVIIRNNYIHHTGTEGMYIGNSFFLGHTLVACDTVVLPHIIDGVQIYNNRVEYAGWDGIQVGCALHNCNIHDNYVYKDSQEEKLYQMSGIMINTGSSCNAYNNIIANGQGSGIIIQGTGGQKYFNNLIINAGKYYDFNDQILTQQFGIFCKYKYINPPDSSFVFFNNTIINAKSDGIRFMNTHSENNMFINNIIINPGAYIYYDTNGSVNTTGQDAYIHNYLHQSDVFMANNIFERSCKNQYFVDTLNNNYHLSYRSPGFNQGQNLLTQGISFDLDNLIRPFDRFFDIGAYELPSAEKVDHVDCLFDVLIYPNPVVNDVHLKIQVMQESIVNVRIYNDLGFYHTLLHGKKFLIGKDYYLGFDLGYLDSGFYYLSLETEKSIVVKKFLKI